MRNTSVDSRTIMELYWLDLQLQREPDGSERRISLLSRIIFLRNPSLRRGDVTLPRIEFLPQGAPLHLPFANEDRLQIMPRTGIEQPLISRSFAEIMQERRELLEASRRADAVIESLQASLREIEEEELSSLQGGLEEVRTSILRIENAFSEIERDAFEIELLNIRIEGMNRVAASDARAFEILDRIEASDARTIAALNESAATARRTVEILNQSSEESRRAIAAWKAVEASYARVFEALEEGEAPLSRLEAGCAELKTGMSQTKGLTAITSSEIEDSLGVLRRVEQKAMQPARDNAFNTLLETLSFEKLGKAWKENKRLFVGGLAASSVAFSYVLSVTGVQRQRMLKIAAVAFIAYYVQQVWKSLRKGQESHGAQNGVSAAVRSG